MTRYSGSTVPRSKAKRPPTLGAKNQTGVIVVVHLPPRLAVAPAFLLAACTTSFLLDTAGHPVRSPLIAASSPGLRVVADSAASGLRAVAEVVLLESAPYAYGYEGPELTLLDADRDLRFPVAIMRETPICAGPNRRQDNDGDPRLRDMRRDDPQQCQQLTQVVRAEFRLRRRPQVGESVYVNVGATPRGARWSAP